LEGLVNKLLPQNQRQALGCAWKTCKFIRATKSVTGTWTLEGLTNPVNTFMLQNQKPALGTFEGHVKMVKQKSLTHATKSKQRKALYRIDSK
jgi:hypothetical protein